MVKSSGSNFPFALDSVFIYAPANSLVHSGAGFLSVRKTSEAFKVTHSNLSFSIAGWCW